MRYLVTGGHGRLGTHLCPLIDAVAPKRSELDIENTISIERAMHESTFDAILHLAAICDRKRANSDPASTYATNVIGTRNMAQAAKATGKKIVYVSTEAIFDCLTGNYREDSVPSPSDWYGFTKLAGELEVQRSGTRYLIIRTSFRPESWNFPTAFTNVSTTADYVDVIANKIASCLSKDLTGIIHIGTPIKSFYELAKRRNKNIQPEENQDPNFGKRRDLNIDRWLRIKNQK